MISIQSRRETVPLEQLELGEWFRFEGNIHYVGGLGPHNSRECVKFTRDYLSLRSLAADTPVVLVKVDLTLEVIG